MKAEITGMFQVTQIVRFLLERGLRFRNLGFCGHDLTWTATFILQQHTGRLHAHVPIYPEGLAFFPRGRPQGPVRGAWGSPRSGPCASAVRGFQSPLAQRLPVLNSSATGLRSEMEPLRSRHSVVPRSPTGNSESPIDRRRPTPSDKVNPDLT